MRKSMLKQEFLEFRIGEAEGLHKGYDRMQKILSQLNQLKAKPEDEDINLKFLRALPSSWPQDPTFVSATSASKKMSYGESLNYSSTTTYSVLSNSKTESHRSGNVIKDVLQSFVADTKPEQQLAVHKFEQKARRKIDFDKKESARFNKKKEEDSKALITVDTLVDWTDHDGKSDRFITSKEFGMIVGCDTEDAIEEGAAKVYNLITGADTEFAKADSMKAVPPPLSRDYTSPSDHSDWMNHRCPMVQSPQSLVTLSLCLMTLSLVMIVTSLQSVSTSENEAEIESNVGTPIQEPIIVQDLPSFSCNSSDKNENTSRTSCNKNGYFNKKAGHFRKHASYVSKLCFVCGSGTHLIKDCDFYEKQMVNRTVGIGVTIPPARPQPVPTVSSGWWKSTARPMPYFSRLASSYFHTYTPYVPTMSYTHMKYGGDRWATTVSPQQENPFLDAEVEGIFDSGCSRSMTGNKERLDDFQVIQGEKVTFGGSEGRITGKGTIRTPTLDFENVYYVKELQHFNLFSISQICDKKNRVLFTDTECLVLSKDFKLPDESMVVLRVLKKHNLYTINLNNLCPRGNLACLVAHTSVDESLKWHRRMGHVNYKNMNRLVKDNLVRGLPPKFFKNDHTCVVCCNGKQHKASYKAINTVSSIFEPLQLLHMDLFGPTSIRSIDHKYYCLVITDDYSRFCWLFFLEHNDATYLILRDFIHLVENQLNKKREYSNAKTPQQNRIAERKNRTLIEAARTMLAESKLPTMFWTEVVRTACYVLNRVLVTSPHNKTPYALLTGNIPSVSHFKPFGCHVTILNTSDHLEETMNLRFLEEKPNVQGLGHEWYFDIDYLTDTLGYKHVQANQSTRTQGATTNPAGTHDANSDSDCDEQIIIVPSYPSHSIPGTEPKDTSGDEVDDSLLNSADEIFQKELARLKGQEQRATSDAESLGLGFANDAEELQKTTSAKTVPTGSLPVPTCYIPVPAGATMPTTRFLCPSDLGNHDPSPGVFSSSSYDDEFGAAVNTVASTVEVSLVATRRICTIHPQSLIIRDLTLAVQMRSKVKQTTNSDSAFISSMYDQQRDNHTDFQHCLFAFFLSQVEPRSVTQALDDPSWVDAMQEEMQQFKFQNVWVLVDLPEGLQVQQRPDGIFINQDNYVQEILNKFDLGSVRMATTPYEAPKPKSKNESDSPVNVYLYRSMIGSLMYLTALRPDIMFTVSACSRNQVTPTTSNLEAVKKIFKYLKSQPKLGLWYPRESPLVLEAYSDSDYAGANKDRKSQLVDVSFWVLWIQNQLLDYSASIPSGVSKVPTGSYVNVPTVSTLLCDQQPTQNLNPTSTSSMAALRYRDEHNKVGYLLKPTGSDDYHPIIDFLRDSHIRYVLTHNPIIFDSLVKQFWSMATFMSSELADDGGIDDLPIAKIYSGMNNLGTKSGSWDQFGSPIAVALIVYLMGDDLTGLAIFLRGWQQTSDPNALVFEHGQSLDPNTASFDKTDAGPFTNMEDEPLGGSVHMSPPRSTQAPPACQPSGGAEDPITLTALSSVVSTLVQKVNSLETELKDHKKLFKDVMGKLVKKVKSLEVKLKTKKRKLVVSDSDQDEGGKQDVNLDALCALANAAVTVDSNIFPCGASSNPAASTSVPAAVPTGDSAVPTCASTVPIGASSVPTDSPSVPADVPSSVATAGVSTKTKAPMVDEDILVKARTCTQMEKDRLSEEAAKRLHDEEQAQLDRQRAELQRRRQQEVLDSAMYYNKTDWIHIMAQAEANASLSKTLVGDDVSEDNFSARMVALIKRKRQALAEKLAQERQNRPMTQAQQRTYMQQFFKNQSCAVYSTRWSMARVKSFTDAQLKEEFEKIQKAISNTKIQAFSPLKRTGLVLEEPSSKRQKFTEAHLPSVPAVPQSSVVSSHTSSGTRRKSLARKRLTKPKSTLQELDRCRCLDIHQGDINALYRIDQSTKHFNTLRQILHMVDRQDLVLFDSHEGGKGSCIWQHQHLWEIRIYTLSNVHILETVSGEVLSMFADVSYPLFVKLMEKMLRHKLEIDKDVVRNDMTTAELIKSTHVAAVVPKSVAGSRFPEVLQCCWFEFKYADAAFSRDILLTMYVVPAGRVVVPTGRINLRRTSVTGFPAQSIRSSDVIATDSPYLLVLNTRASQSRQHVDTSLIHVESPRPPTAELFDVDSGRISIRH
nr:hypothetical protein [Tanacetum cinerariifolium]